MAFINERIPEEEKEKFTFEVTTRPDGSKPTLYKWTIDRERNAFLLTTKKSGGDAGGSETITYFVLVWNSHVVQFSGSYERSRDNAGKITQNWNIENLEIPSSISDLKEEIVRLIRDALDVRGVLYSRKNIDYVIVNI